MAEAAILSALQAGPIANSLDFSKDKELDHLAVVGALKSLGADNYVTMTADDHEGWKLTDDGHEAVAKGSPEAVVYGLVSEGGSTKADIEQLAGAMAKVGLSQCMAAKWLRIDKDQGGKIFREAGSISDAVQAQLKGITSGELPAKADIEKLKKRKMVVAANYKTYKVEKGAAYAPTRTKAAADITLEMIQDGSWKTQAFKPYNFAALGADPAAGRLHPLLKVRAQFREIFLEMGFEEMPTSRFVETSFWNFDALFQPQAHPEAFFLKLGMTDIRFKPTYNPYTEPSMEIFHWHKGLNKYVEIGNSGMFRPEMLRPMGFPEDVSCIAWGLSLERPTMILYGIDNIRDLFGHKVDLSMIKTNPICRLVK
ncbi:tRNA synthetases class II core domain (F)-domain-containing protein [Baffinella frigidus]|nr:tRNA synthetases class II core domain (F)-domain-containing protein [Cryptophyta sp. CCMP2293]